MRQLFQPGLLPLKTCFSFAIYLVLVLISLNTGNITKISDKIILLLLLLLYFPNPVIYCDQRPVTNTLFGQSCLHSFFNCSVTRGKYITLPMFFTSYIIEGNKLRLKITEEPHTGGWGEQKNQQKNYHSTCFKNVNNVTTEKCRKLVLLKPGTANSPSNELLNPRTIRNRS